MAKLRLDTVQTFRGETNQEWSIILDDGRTIEGSTQQEHCYADVEAPDETIAVAGRELTAEEIFDAALVMGDCTEEGDEVELDADWLKRSSL